MKGKILALVLCTTLLLGGCGWLDGSYVSVEAHREQRHTPQLDGISVSSQRELMTALETLVTAGAQSATIQISGYPEEKLPYGVEIAAQYIRDTYPLGAYAVEEIQYELGTSGGQVAVAVQISYNRNLSELQRIRNLADMDAARQVIYNALSRCSPSEVLLVADYTTRDLTQLVEDYATEFPQTVMETPLVTETVYGSGKSRVVELIFTYQNGRDDLRQMQVQVEPVFNSAVLYVSGGGSERQKFAQLYGFLMERFAYKLETSLTPAYSLLCHGVGDSRAFAMVYGAMCRAAGLECMSVTGTCNGDPRTWNLICEGGNYYHVDLLSCKALGYFRSCTDGEMTGYVWDYSAYPACTGETAPEPAETVEEKTDEIEKGA